MNETELALLWADWSAGRLDADGLRRLDALLAADDAACRLVLTETALEQGLRRAEVAAQTRTARWRPVLVAAAAALLVLALGLIALLPEQVDLRLQGAALSEGNLRPGAVVHTGDAGGELLIGAESVVEMASQTRLRLERIDAETVLHLLAGSATCAVQPGSRPFQITTSVGAVRVTGTRFNVGYGGDEMRHMLVRVLAGTVLVTGAWGERSLNAGEAGRFPPDDSAAEEHRLTVEMQEARLSEVVAFLQDRGMQVILDPQVVGNGRQPTITLQGDLRKEQFLRLIAWQAGLEWQQSDGALHLGVPDQSAGLRLYDLTDLEAVAGLITALADIDEAVAQWRGQTAIRAPGTGHEAVDWLLQALRLVRSQEDLTSGQELEFAGTGDMDVVESSVLTVEFEGSSGAEALSMLCSNLDLPSAVHPEAREALQQPVSMQMADVPVGSILRWLGTITGMPWRLWQGAICVGPGIPQVPVVRVYATPSREDAMDLLQLLRRAAADWEHRRHWVCLVDEWLVVSQQRDAHDQVAQLLAQLRDGLGLDADPGLQTAHREPILDTRQGKELLGRARAALQADELDLAEDLALQVVRRGMPEQEYEARRLYRQVRAVIGTGDDQSSAVAVDRLLDQARERLDAGEAQAAAEMAFRAYQLDRSRAEARALYLEAKRAVGNAGPGSDTDF
ncbi:MAG: FecR domain-containing protein [Planctomycetota bacterium]